MSDYLPKFTGPTFTVIAAADITGGRLVSTDLKMSGDTDVDVIGVAAHDVTTGKPVTIYDLNVGVHRLVASGAVSAGAEVVSDTGGKVQALAAVSTPTAGDVTGARAKVGAALTAAVNDGDIILVKKV